MASHELFPILFATFSCTVATAVCLALGGKPSPKRTRAEFEAVDPFERKPGFTDADFYTAFHFYPCDVRRLAKALRLPKVVKDPLHGHKASREDALLYLLYRWVTWACKCGVYSLALASPQRRREPAVSAICMRPVRLCQHASGSSIVTPAPLVV